MAGKMIDTRGGKRRLAFERGQDPDLATYLRDAEKLHVVFTVAEEKALATRVQAGDRKARLKLIECNLLLVVGVAAVYAGQGVPIMDLIGFGNIGLIEAVGKFKPKGRARFSTVATWWIRAYVARNLVNTGSMIRLPHNVAAARQRLHRLDTAYYLDAGQRMTDVQAGEAVGLTPKAIARIRAAQDSAISLDQSHTADVGGETIGEALPDPGPTPEDAIQAKYDNPAMRHALRRAMAGQCARDRTILVRRFGLGGQPPATFEDIGEELGINRETVRKAEARTLRRLKVSIESQLGTAAASIAALFKAS